MTTPPKLRVLMTTDAVGGAWTFSTSLARSLAARHCAVHLVVMGPRPAPHQLDVFRGLYDISVEVTDLALEWLDPGGTDVARARKRLQTIAGRERPDIVHLNGFREALADWNAPTLVTAHSCVRTWWRAVRGGEPQGVEWQAYMGNVRAALQRTPWVAPTEAFRHSIASLYLPSTPGRTIRNGIEPAERPASKEPFILAAGRLWDEAKNISALGAAARRLDWPIRIAGDGVPAWAAGSDRLTSGLTLLGRLSREELQAEMRRAAIFASPAIYEPFGLAVLEAARAGCALALADIATFRELWDGAALFADPLSDRAFCDILVRLRNDGDLRTKLGAAAAERARRYTLADTTEAYLDAYDSVQCRHRTPTPTRFSQSLAATMGMPA